MQNNKISRRNFLYTTAQWTALGGTASLLAACGDSGGGGTESGTAETSPASACVDAESLAPAESSLRQSVAYTDTSPDPQTICGQCAYFHADGESGCGQCDILGGVVSATGHCVSWAPRA